MVSSAVSVGCPPTNSNPDTRTLHSVFANGSPHSPPRRRPKSPKTSRLSSSRDEHACVTSSSTKVSRQIPSEYRLLSDKHPSLPDSKVVYRRYASLFFIAGIDATDNELITLEIVHRYVEQMDKYYGNVCELDIIFNFQKAYFILDELLIAGELQESSKKNVLRCISQEDALEDMEVRSILPLFFFHDFPLAPFILFIHSLSPNTLFMAGFYGKQLS